MRTKIRGLEAAFVGRFDDEHAFPLAEIHPPCRRATDVVESCSGSAGSSCGRPLAVHLGTSVLLLHQRSDRELKELR
jgi:hypothetical protein